MFDGLIEWYKMADHRASGLISINPMLLGFVTISAFVILGSSERDISTVKSLAETFLILFFISIIISVILAVWSLWGRAIDFSLRETMHLSKSNR